MASTDVERNIGKASRPRIHWSSIIIHPMQFNLTFLQRPNATLELKRAAKIGLLGQVLLGMASVSNAPFRLNSFTVSDAIESRETLSQIVTIHFSRGILRQAQLFLFIQFLDRPATFIKNIF